MSVGSHISCGVVGVCAGAVATIEIIKNKLNDAASSASSVNTAIQQHEQLHTSTFSRIVEGKEYVTKIISGNVYVNNKSINYLQVTETKDGTTVLSQISADNYTFDQLSGQSNLSAEAARLVTQTNQRADHLLATTPGTPAQSGFFGDFFHSGLMGDAVNYITAHYPHVGAVVSDVILPVAPFALASALIGVGYYANKSMIEKLGYEEGDIAPPPRKASPSLSTRINAQVHNFTNKLGLGT